ncbi:MAG: ABC transporter permease [archaeon]
MIKDYFSLAFKSIAHRKLRAWLTVIGIIIGVGSIIALVAISMGLKTSIETEFEKMGVDKIFIGPKGYINVGSQGLTTDDMETIDAIGDVEWSLSLVFAQGKKVEFNKKEVYAQIAGYQTKDLDKKFEDMNLKAESGSLFKGGETDKVIVGSRVGEDFFDKTIRVKENIEISGKRFTVVGVLAEIGNTQDDTMIIIPEDTARDLFDKPNEVSYIEVKIKPGNDINTVAAKIKKELKDKRNDENFEVITPEQLLKTFGDILMIIQVVLIGIAAISLLVGAIGIMNSMYTSVLERTKEIGIMKSVGARNSDILNLFLIESGIIGLVGGFFGIILGILIAKLVEVLAKNAGFGILKINVSIYLMIGGLLFAFIIGSLSGLWPAYKAAKLKPVDALRK